MTFAPRDPAEVLPATDDSEAHQKDGSTILGLRLVFFLLCFILSYTIQDSDPALKLRFFFFLKLLLLSNWFILVYSHSMVKLQESKVPLSDILPQDLLVDILTERFQVSWLFF